jgi:hypothetical protein
VKSAFASKSTYSVEGAGLLLFHRQATSVLQSDGRERFASGLEREQQPGPAALGGVL